MDRALRAPSALDRAWRLLTPLLIASLLLAVPAVSPPPAEAGGSAAASLRSRQLSAEAAMRRADQQIKKLQQERRHHAKRLKKAKRKLAQAKRRHEKAHRRASRTQARLGHLDLTLARATRVRPNPSGKQTVDKPAVRKQIRKLEKKLRWLDKKERKTRKKVEKVHDLKQSRMRKPTRERIAKRRAERERAEARLEAAIAAMITLTRDRAGRLGAAGSMRWRKPLAGRISQRYGCTGYPTNPRRGGCRHFHDGVDLAAPVGSKIRASADGLVAYVGYSPWDGVKRAFIVVLVHPGGYESVYAHLKPTRKVRAGQVVERGDVIGTVGMTGLTTGPHVHWEVRRGGTWLNPLKVGR